MMQDLVRIAQDKPVVDSHTLSGVLGEKHALLKHQIEKIVDANPTLRMDHDFKMLTKQNRTQVYLLYPRLYFIILLDMANKFFAKANYLVDDIVCDMIELCKKENLSAISSIDRLEYFDSVLELCEINNLKPTFNELLIKGIE